jgi:hypothetical protein
MNSILKTLVCSLALLASGHSFALYRCGNVFQDRACDGSDVQAAPAATARPTAKPQAASSAAASAATVSPFAMACARVGKSALDIIWKREAGALREAQYANAEGNLEHKNLVDAVYAQRGTAPQIRAAIETDCIGERQRAADANAALAAVQKAQSSAPAAARATPAATAPLAVAAAPARKASDSAAHCTNLSSQLSAVQERARSGGGVATMEQIGNERRAIDSKISAAKC